ncbi:glycerol-3-phosphate dehydrogenase, partial [Balamuthia mandrillaris]
MDSTSSSNGPLRVAIMGSGNWGSAIAKIVGENVKLHSDLFHTTVNMWVYEELIEGQKLTDIINTKHENVKYLPGIGLPENVIAVPDSVEAAKGANLLIFVLPHQFVEGLCKKLKGHIAPDCKAISLIKGMLVENGSPKLISQLIHDALEVNTAVLMGANIATEVAKGELSEATIGFREEVETAKVWQKLFNTSTFRINIIEDVAGVELCGALKNIVAIGAGFCDGLGLSPNSKVAIIRCGLAEMRKFCESFYSGIAPDTFFESCGAADLIVTCYCGRNRKVAEAFAKTRKSFDELEQEMLNGQKLQGTLTAKE